MGYNSTATTLSLTAKLTPIGRQRMVSTNNSLIKTFSLGDSDANYQTSLLLNTGDIPALNGNIGFGSTSSNSTATAVALKSVLILNTSGMITKPVSSQSVNILTETAPNGSTIISGSNLTFNVINRLNYTTDKRVNLFSSFGLPITTADFNLFTATTTNFGGYSNTSYSGVATDKILVVAINNSTIGECIDGKTVKVELPTSAGTYTMYSTFQSNQQALNILDSTIAETNVTTKQFGQNIAMLFSDDILKPNGGNTSLSWATGYGLNRPFSLNGKQTFNAQTNTNIGQSGDTIVGLAYLDKGFVVITHPTIVDDYLLAVSATTATTITLDSVSTNVFQIINCIADRGEFGSTTNKTFEAGNTPRISEVGLYDEIGNLIAVAKTDRHVTKNVNEFLALSIKITM
jgi:hypothetical protein